MEVLLRAPLPQVLCFLFLVFEPGLLLSPLAFFAFQVQLLVGAFCATLNCTFGLLEIVLQHAPHPVQLQSLLVVELVLVLLLLGPLSLLLDLLVQPLFLLVLEELPPGIIF